MTRIDSPAPSPRPTPAPTPAPTKPAAPKAPVQKDELSLQAKAKGVFMKGVQFVQTTWDQLQDTGTKVYGKAEEGVKVVGKAIKTGDWGPVYEKIIDPALDQSVLGPDDLYQDPTDLGPLLTDRLAIGESVSFHVESGVTLPLEEFGIPNAKLDEGGTIKLIRVQKKDASGKLLQEPKDAKGNPPSELLASLSLEGKAGVSYSAKAGVKTTVDINGHSLGLEASVGAQAETGLRGKVSFSFAFDPSQEGDMTLLGNFLKRTTIGTSGQLVPGVGTPLTAGAMLDGNFLKRLMPHAYSISGEGGLYAQAMVNAKAGAGLFPSSVAEASTLKDKTKQILGNLSKNLLQVGGAAGAVGEYNLGFTKDTRTGDSTVYAQLDGMAGLNGHLPLYTPFDRSIAGSRTIGFTYDKAGHLKDVTVQDEFSKDEFSKGLRNAISDMTGRTINDGFNAQLNNAQIIRVRYQLKPGEAAKVNFLDLLSCNKQVFESVNITAISRETFQIQASLNLDLGAEVGLRGAIVGTHEQESP